MTKVFNEKHFAKLDSPERKKLLPVDKTIKEFNLKPDDIVADFGCGVGYFTLPISKLVNGKVLAIDISDVMLEELDRRMSLEGVSNIELINSKRDTDLIKENSIDFLIMSLVLHEVENTQAFLDDIKSNIKEKGRICVIEWKKDKKTMGPPSEHRIGLRELKEISQSINLIVNKEIDISDEFYGLILEKQIEL